MRVLLFFICILLIPVASAYDGVFEIMNHVAYNESLDIVTVYNVPDMTVQSNEDEYGYGHIRGWVDIVGFSKTVRIDDTVYGGESPVIKYAVWDEGLGGRYVFQSIDVIDVRHSTRDGNTTAYIDIHLKWYHNRFMESNVFYDEYATFSTWEYLPPGYPELTKTGAGITVYNYSFNPHVEIDVPLQQNETKTTFTYDNETITRINMLGIAGTGAVNLSKCLYWEGESDLFVTKNTTAILKIDASVFNPSKLQIVTSSPYESKNVMNYTISTVQYDQEEQIKKSGVIWPLAILIIFGCGVKKCIKLWSEMI